MQKTEKQKDEYEELERRHREFFSGGQFENPWEEQDEEDDWREVWVEACWDNAW